MPIRPSLNLATLPRDRPFAERLRLAADAGFEGVEVEVLSGPAAEIGEAADRAGVEVHSVYCLANYTYPLSSRDPATRAAGVAATLKTLEAGRILGAATMLLIPGKVDDETSYTEVSRRSLEVIRSEILPFAEECGIILGIENVWNGFLLSPLDFRDYVDSFGSASVRAYLDVGNIIFGQAEGWIDILGDRIVGLHLKDFQFDRWKGRFDWRKIGDGEIDWARVRAALARAGYSGWAVLAEPESAERRISKYLRLRVNGLSARFGRNPVTGAAQGWLGRRLLVDAMRRFHRHVSGAAADRGIPADPRSAC